MSATISVPARCNSRQGTLFYLRCSVLCIADATGTVALLACLGAGSAYQQAPLRHAPKAEKEKEPLIKADSLHRASPGADAKV